MTDSVVTRLRHEAARRRTMVVREKRMLAPNYLSIVFDCDDFGDFVSAAPDDHVKLFIPGAHSGEGRPPMRDYTPRHWDEAAGEFVIEFALHDDPGPATAWAIGAEPGDTIQIGGPRGSGVLADTLDWYWLIGDETALPAIGRRMAENPAASIHAVVAVAGADEEVSVVSSDTHSIRWVHRDAANAGDAAALLEAVSEEEVPEGDGFVWIAAEAGVARALREALVARGVPLNRIKAAGYWTRGQADTTARFD